MWDVCLKILLALLMIVGLTDVFRMLCNWFLKTRVKGKIVYLLPLSGHSEEAEIALRGAVHRLRWFSGKEEKKIICVDCGVDKETAEVCRKAAEVLRGTSFCSREEAVKKIEAMFAKQ